MCLAQGARRGRDRESSSQRDEELSPRTSLTASCSARRALDTLSNTLQGLQSARIPVPSRRHLALAARRTLTRPRPLALDTLAQVRQSLVLRCPVLCVHVLTRSSPPKQLDPTRPPPRPPTSPRLSTLCLASRSTSPLDSTRPPKMVTLDSPACTACAKTGASSPRSCALGFPSRQADPFSHACTQRTSCRHRARCSSAQSARRTPAVKSTTAAGEPPSLARPHLRRQSSVERALTVASLQ